MNTHPSNRPRIAIPVPMSTDFEYNRRSWKMYAAAVEQSGGEAVEVPLDMPPAATAKLVTGCDGILLPGSGADVNPQKYGQEPIEACAPTDRARENVDELLLQDAHNLHKPILAICFGVQILNVWRGGTLVQDLMVMPVNHGAGRSVAVAHTVAIAPDSQFGALLTDAESPERDGFRWLPVNSSHHQAIAIPGDGLRVIARSAADGVIEGVEGGELSAGEAHFVLGVQWHPERSYDSSAASRALFDRFIAAAAAWIPRPIHTSVA